MYDLICSIALHNKRCLSDLYTRNWVAKSDFVRHINKLAEIL